MTRISELVKHLLCPFDSSSHKICGCQDDGKGLNVGEDYKMFHCGMDFIVIINRLCSNGALLTRADITKFTTVVFS